MDEVVLPEQGNATLEGPSPRAGTLWSSAAVPDWARVLRGNLVLSGLEASVILGIWDGGDMAQGSAGLEPAM